MMTSSRISDSCNAILSAHRDLLLSGEIEASPMSPATREADVEQAALDLFQSLGWKTANVYHETFGDRGTLGRETSSEPCPYSAASARRSPSSTPRLPPTPSTRPSSRSPATAPPWASRTPTATSTASSRME